MAYTNNPRKRAWFSRNNMIRRCCDPTNKRYGDYGGRGITICDRWLESFENFVEDMGYPPDRCTLDRLDNNGPYAPWNCKWSTRKEQQNNMRVNKWLEFNGERKTLAQWSEELGINRSTLAKRISRGRWKPEEALSVLVVPHKKHRPTERVDY